MQVIGFNFTKIHVERTDDAIQGSVPRNTNIEFLELMKEEVSLLKDAEALKLQFRFSIIYGKSESKKEERQAEVAFEGNMLLAVNKDESRDLLKSWKKREISNIYKIPLFNIILRKCTTRALTLEEELNLPPHIPLPIIQQKQE